MDGIRGSILPAFTQLWEHGPKGQSSRGVRPVTGLDFVLCLFENYFERFHDEATPGDHGGHNGDVHHLGPGAAEHIDYHAEDFAEHDEDYGGNDGSLGFQVQEELHHSTHGPQGARGECDST